jgi:hypothetical protein
MQFRLETISEKILVLVLILFVVSLTLCPIQSEDIFMYLAIARDYFQRGEFSTSDPFVYPAIKYWTILHQWLGYFAFYGTYLLGGYNAIIALKVLLVLGVLTAPLLWAQKNSAALVCWAISVLIAGFAISFRLMERTSLFSDLLVTLVLGILLSELNVPSRKKFFLPLVFLVWVNVHPGFPTGWALCGLALLANIRQWKTKSYRQLFAVTAASVLICLLNPRGLDGLLYPFVFSQNEGAVFRKLYFEWFPTMSPIFFWHSQTVFILGLICLNLFLLLKTSRSKPVFEILASLFMIFYGLYAIRFVTTMAYALVLVNTVLALRLGTWSWIKSARWITIFLAIGLAVKNFGWGYNTISGHRDVGWGLDENVVPVKATALLQKTNFEGNIFNSHMFGGYLAWALGGNHKVFYHGFVTDTDFYLHEYIAFFKGRESFDAQVAKYNIKVFILDRFQGGEPLLRTLTEHPHWRLGFMDEASLMFIPKP